MTKRLTKFLMPRPMSVSFARELVQLMTGHDDNSAAGQYAIAHTLETAWLSQEPVNLTTIFHRLRSGALPSAKNLRSLADVDESSRKDFHKVLRTITTLVDELPDDQHEMTRATEMVLHRWLESMKLIASGAEPISMQLASLLATYGAASPYAVDELEQELAMEGVPSGLRALLESGGAPRGVRVMHFGGSDPMALIGELLGMRASPETGKPAAHATSGSATASDIDPTKPALKIFNQADVVALVSRMPAVQMPNEGNAQQRRLLESMSNDAGMRQLAEVPEGDPLAELYARFPHFKEVLDMVKASLALAGCGSEGRPVRIPPMLLRGTPGTGKTYFAQELARVLGLHFVERDLSVTSEAFVLAGMDAGWKNSKPGIVFDALVNGKTANPCILLNEVDKAAVSGTHNSPLAPMYSLLEPTSSRQFSDEFVPVTMDTSRVVWVLTANNGEIPEPILSRVEIFDIRTPTPEECRVIAASVWKSICERDLPKDHGFSQELSEELLVRMSQVSPRHMRKLLTASAGLVVLDNRRKLQEADLERSRQRYAPPAKSAIGFTSSK